MRYKKIILLILLLSIGIYIVYVQSHVDGSHLLYISKEESVIPKKLKIEIVQSQNDGNHTMALTCDNNRTNDKMEYYREIYSIIASQNSAAEQLKVGKEIEVENFFDSQYEYSYFVPFVLNDKIVAVSIFREYTRGQRKLGRIAEIRDNWFSYPPVMLSDAANELQNQYPNATTQHISGYYYIEDGEIPYYLFQSSDRNATRFYLVSAYDKHIITKKARKLKPLSEESVPGWINAKGYLEINETRIAKLPQDEQIQLRKEAEMTNEYIQKGIMKFDQEMNIIFDKRTEEDFQRENMLFEEELAEDQDNSEILFTIDSTDVENVSFE